MAKRIKTSLLVPSELDIFSGPQRSYAIDDAEFTSYKPVNALTVGSSHIEFLSVGKGSFFYRSFKEIPLRLTCKITSDTGAALEAKDDSPKVTLVNNALHSLIQSVNCYLNGTDITAHSDLYSYSAYLQTVLAWNKDDAADRLTAEGFDPDTGSDNSKWEDGNTGLAARFTRFKSDTEFELYGRLLLDIASCEFLFPDGIDVRIRLNLHESNFYLFADKAATASLQITGATLYMKHVYPSPSLLLAHAKAFSVSKALYHYKKVVVKNFTVAAKQSSFSIENVFTGRSPLVCFMVLVSNESFVGNMLLNPFSFKHYAINSITYQLDNRVVVLDNMDFTKNRYTYAFAQLYSAMGIHRSPESTLVTYDRFKKGLFVTGADFSLTQDGLSTAPGHSRAGNLRIEVKFGSAPAEAISAIVFGVFDGLISVDKERTVTVEE